MISKDKYLTSEEIEDLKRLLKNDRDSLLIKLAFYTGARESELVQLSKDSFNLKDGSVFIKGTKGSNDRDVDIPKELIRQILDLENDKPFGVSTRMVRYIWSKYRLGKKGFHCLRHTFAINTLEASKNISTVQVALGHKNIANTLIYAKHVSYRNEMKAAAKKMQGKL